MKAKCKKELWFIGSRFEVGKEYDFDCKVVYLPAEASDVVLARGNKTRHLQYSTHIDIRFGKELVPATIYLYDRQYCVSNYWKSPAIDPYGLFNGELICFDNYFIEVK